MPCAGRAHIWKSGYTLWRGLDFFSFFKRRVLECVCTEVGMIRQREWNNGFTKSKILENWKVGQQSTRGRICELCSRCNNLGKIQTACVSRCLVKGLESALIKKAKWTCNPRACSSWSLDHTSQLLMNSNLPSESQQCKIPEDKVNFSTYTVWCLLHRAGPDGISLRSVATSPTTHITSVLLKIMYSLLPWRRM